MFVGVFACALVCARICLGVVSCRFIFMCVCMCVWGGGEVHVWASESMDDVVAVSRKRPSKQRCLHDSREPDLHKRKNK